MFTHNRLQVWIVSILTWLILGSIQPVQAYTPEYSIYLDVGARLTASQAFEQKFSKNNNKFAVLGFQNAAAWVLLPVDAEKANAKLQYLAASPANIIHTELFQLVGQEWIQIPKTELSPQMGGLAKNRNSYFDVSDIMNVRPLLLRVTSQSVLAFHLNITDRDEISLAMMGISTTLAYFLGLTTIPVLVLLVIGVTRPDWFALSIALWISANTLLRMLASGMEMPNWTLNQASLAQITFNGLLPIAYGITLVTLLNDYKVSPWFRRLAVVCLASIVLTFTVFITFPETAKIGWLQLLCLCPLAMMIMLVFWGEVRRKLGFMLTGVCALAALTTLTFRIALFGFATETLESFVNLSVQFPFLMLLCAAVISSLRKKKLHQVRLDEDNTQLEKKRLLIEQKKNKQQRQFLLMLTHELKNSLSVMRLFVGMTPIQGKFSQLAEQSITDMSAIIDRSLEVDRLDHKEVELFTESVDLIELIQLLIDGSSDPDRIRFDEDIGSCQVTTDRLLLKTVVNNLLDNSVKYSEQTSIIHIALKHSMDPRLEKEGRLGAEVSISNHIPVDSSPDCSQVFEKYYRGPLANKLSGSGLGLYLAKSMSALIDGDLRVSVMNTRIIFKLWLPL